MAAFLPVLMSRDPQTISNVVLLFPKVKFMEYIAQIGFQRDIQNITVPKTFCNLVQMSPKLDTLSCGSSG